MGCGCGRACQRRELLDEPPAVSGRLTSALAPSQSFAKQQSGHRQRQSPGASCFYRAANHFGIAIRRATEAWRDANYASFSFVLDDRTFDPFMARVPTSPIQRNE